jgi:hypothetical protein
LAEVATATRGDADEEQQGRDEKTATDAEHARENADDAAQPQKGKGVDRDFCDGEENLHVAQAFAACFFQQCNDLQGASNAEP